MTKRAEEPDDFLDVTWEDALLPSKATNAKVSDDVVVAKCDGANRTATNALRHSPNSATSFTGTHPPPHCPLQSQSHPRSPS